MTTDLTTLPPPLTPADCDLRDFAFMPLDVVRLRDSDLAMKAEADEFRCAVLLWCASWHQVPSASLPDDDKVLAQYAGYGRVVKEWQKVRDGALRGWVKCADGRLYHPVVAEKASEAWIAKLRQRLKTECGRIKKHNERHKTNIPFPDFDTWFAAGCPVGHPLPVPGDTPPPSQGTSGDVPDDIPPLSLDDLPDVPGEKHSKGQGEGQGQGQLTTKPDTSSQASTEVGAGENGRDDDRLEAPLPTNRNVQIALLLRAQGVQATSQHPVVCVTWAQNVMVTDEVLNLAIAKARTAKGDKPIPLAYLTPIVEQQLQELAKPAPAIAAPQKGDPGHWRQSAKGIEAMGASLGMQQHANELHRDYAARIELELANREGPAR